MTWTEAAGRSIVYARSQGRCEVCTRPAHSVHHRVKRGQGGTWDPTNLLHVCGDGTRYCHGWVEANPAHAVALGLWVRTGDDPARVPAYLHPTTLWRAWWFADDEGCWTWADDTPPPAHPLTPARLDAVRAITLGRSLPLLLR